VAELIQETPRVASLVLDVPGWAGHLAGQHVDVRLTADDGYQAQRSYSIASAPEDPRLALTVERLDDGEVSPYLVGELRVGDQVELRCPIGGYFVWEAGDGRPLLDRLSAADPDLKVAHTLTRHQPAGWKGYARRIDREMVRDVAWPAAQNPCVFICGPTSFVETAAGLLVDSGYAPTSIKTERFGATGG
jgi:ferredoxin-NADP reductase